jgi:hypothetical protein
MKVLSIIAVMAVGGAIVIGVVLWNSSGSAAECDRGQMVAAMHDAIAIAEGEGRTQVTVDMPHACDDDDMAHALPEVSRSWHVMPGGGLMHEPLHSDP